MARIPMLRSILIISMVLLNLGNLNAQPRVAKLAQQHIAEIETILNIEAKPYQSIKSSTERLKVKRSHNGKWFNASPKLHIYSGDNLLVRRFTRVKILMETHTTRGKLILLPRTLDNREEEAAYTFRKAHSRSSRQKITVLYGGLLINWEQGQQSIFAAGTRARFSDAKAILLVEHTGDEGFLFLQKGQVFFPNFPELEMLPNEAVRLKRGNDPVLVSMPPHILTQLNHFVDYNHTQIWPKPFWKQPLFYIPFTATTLGSVLYGFTGILNPDKKIKGTVVINAPER